MNKILDKKLAEQANDLMDRMDERDMLKYLIILSISESQEMEMAKIKISLIKALVTAKEAGR